jgi:hypothetical protein
MSFMSPPQSAARNPRSTKTVKTAVRPIDDTCNLPMFDRIEVNVVDVTLKIRIVANNVLPIATLPDTLFAL